MHPFRHQSLSIRRLDAPPPAFIPNMVATGRAYFSVAPDIKGWFDAARPRREV